MKIIGREKEIAFIKQKIESTKSELIPIVGKRRIGKTFLIKETLKLLNVKFFYFTGKILSSKEESIKRLKEALQDLMKEHDLQYIDKNNDWDEFFYNLLHLMKIFKTPVLVFDEVPWLEGKNITENGFKNSFAYYWNAYFEDLNVKIFLTGSSSDWMIDNIIKDNGSLHGRTTDHIMLKPFNLLETKKYLEYSFKRALFPEEIIEYYFAFGGTAYYLSLLKPISFKDNINQLEDFLVDEYDNLLNALFYKKAKKYKKLMNIFQSKGHGFSIEELENLSKISNSTLRRMLKNLKMNGFIQERNFFQQSSKNSLFYLNDCFSYFHFNFLENKSFKSQYNKHRYKIWRGFAFELLCFNQIDLIKKELGFSDLETDQYIWYKKDVKGGSQIDMIIEREDGKIFVCECKFVDHFILNKDQMENITYKIQSFGKPCELILLTLGDIKFQSQNGYINEATKQLNFKKILS